MNQQQQHKRPTATPTPPQAKRQCTDQTQETAAPDDDSAFWLAAAQETSDIVSCAAPSLRPPPSAPPSLRPSASAPQARATNGASRSPACRAPPALRSAPIPVASSSARRPTAPAPGTRSAGRPAGRAGSLAPPCLFGVSAAPRVRPHMASPDDVDHVDDVASPQVVHGGVDARARAPNPPVLHQPSRQNTLPSGPPVLFSAAPRLPPPVITPYVAPPPSSSSSSSSSTSTAGNAARPGHDVAHDNVCCRCAANTRETFTGVVGRGNNAGRRYYKCPQFKQTGGCDFWLWHDEHGKARAAPARDPRAPHYREYLAHDLLYASGGRTAERLVVLARQASEAATIGPDAISADAATSAQAWIEAVTDRWHVTRPVATDPTETDAEGAARRMPLVDLDRPLGETARAACHPHVARQIACTALLSHMLALKGWRVVVQPPLMAFYQHVHLYVARGPYDKAAFWVRVEPAQRLDPRDPPDTPVQYDRLWVQTAGPDPDAPGWLTGSHVDLVAFEIDDGFLLVDRRRLWRYVDRHVMNAPTASPSASAANPGVAAATTVADPAQADHRLLDMGAVGQSPHERRTLISLHAIYQHDDAIGPDDTERRLVQEFMPFDAVVVGPYFERMQRRMPIVDDSASNSNANDNAGGDNENGGDIQARSDSSDVAGAPLEAPASPPSKQA
ncbi:Grf zinc finger domain-containing protein [Pandoravirus kuranda]|uniref:Grf zinc finger domain-containing protein n=1 Tax=Pandoravirus kuranda TaxID=3019033 RepID=A0AA95EEF4_9VIRU|nr:Grf zinc finger domain-containing protein [Pandoravirus kuranda]